VAGNEAAIRLGRPRLVRLAMSACVVCAAGIGFLGARSYAVAAAVVLLYGLLIWLDSSSLTAGAAGSADPERRGATLALHSMAGYAGGAVGPIVIGWILDLSGGMSPMGWGLAFLHLAVIALLGQVARILGPRDSPETGEPQLGAGPIALDEAPAGGASGAARPTRPGGSTACSIYGRICYDYGGRLVAFWLVADRGSGAALADANQPDKEEPRMKIVSRVALGIAVAVLARLRPCPPRTARRRTSCTGRQRDSTRLRAGQASFAS
jgi:MFS family permease